MYVENRTKITNFPTPVYLTPPMKGLPLEFGIGVRGPECFYDGAIRWSTKFSATFSRFDTIPAVTDSQPPSHPASHVAVAITLNAKASSLKINSIFDVVYINSVVYTFIVVGVLGICDNKSLKKMTSYIEKRSTFEPCVIYIAS